MMHMSTYYYSCCSFSGDVGYHGNVSASTGRGHKIFGLIPYSIYSIRIRAWNYELAGEYGSAIWAQTDEESRSHNACLPILF